jgi:hypothetical protein
VSGQPALALPAGLTVAAGCHNELLITRRANHGASNIRDAVSGSLNAEDGNSR